MSKMRMILQTEFTIAANHPSLEGHFPDNPVVPGVVILDQVSRYWMEKMKSDIKVYQQVKFQNMLRPDTNCQLSYHSVNNQKINFKVIESNSSIIISQGTFLVS
ncbi:MAG: hypothetical protein HQL46_00265 [Gammaproteobacteria bacterium]|nr:hypothetical protein [Gammaproteobacteria bacterium]